MMITHLQLFHFTINPVLLLLYDVTSIGEFSCQANILHVW